MKIWVLFEEYNAYDASETLRSWWSIKPTLETLAKALGMQFPCEEDAMTLNIVNIWKGDTVRINQSDYHIAELSEGAQP